SAHANACKTKLDLAFDTATQGTFLSVAHQPFSSTLNVAIKKLPPCVVIACGKYFCGLLLSLCQLCELLWKQPNSFEQRTSSSFEEKILLDCTNQEAALGLS
ncbi:hypothetical protein M8C21_024756, partial [Ambrosia artemisiifolia]